MTAITDRQLAYVIWQNRATRFYLAARRLHQSNLFAPAAYCSFLSIELLLKATLIYWDKAFAPEDAAHGVAKMARMVTNKVPEAKNFKVPTYFYHDQGFLSISRYPRNGKGTFIPGTLLLDLDELFAALIALVPSKHSTELKKILKGKSRSELNILRKGNASIKQLRQVLDVQIC